MKQYRILVFDLDDTLIDNYENVNIKFITDNKENPQIKQREYKKTIIKKGPITGALKK